MALTPQQLMELVKLRALGWSQAEIAEELGVSQQVIGYNLKKTVENACTQAQTNQKRRYAKIRTFVGKR